jgi:hypothetical protein
VNANPASISPQNPYGYQSDFRRLDTVAGANRFCQVVIPALRNCQGQGIILWGQGGEDPRGAMYRPDFDLLPPPVEANWATIAQRFKEAGLKLGVCTRPRHMAVRQDWKQDEIIDINPDDAGHRDMLWRRFDGMIKKGCTLFYLDSFGDSLQDVKLMRWLRSKLGPNVLTFSEHQCDAIFPYSGGYSETTLHADQSPPRYRLWTGERQWEIYRWLNPGAQLISRQYEVKGWPPKDLESVDHWLMVQKITPLLPVNHFNRAPALPQLQAEFFALPTTRSQAP